MIGSMAQAKLRELFNSEHTFATTLLAICVDTYSTDCFSWDFETLTTEIQHDFGDVPAVNIDKVLALIVALTTDKFYQDPIVFMHTVHALSDVSPNWHSLPTELDPADIAWACVEVGVNDLPEEGSPTPSYSDDVAGLVGYFLKAAGFYEAPSLLRWARIPETPQVLDAETVQAQTKLQQERTQELLVSVRSLMEMLNAELNQLNQPGLTSQAAARDYMKELRETSRK